MSAVKTVNDVSLFLLPVSLMVFPCQSSQLREGRFKMSVVTKGQRGEY